MFNVLDVKWITAYRVSRISKLSVCINDRIACTKCTAKTTLEFFFQLRSTVYPIADSIFPHAAISFHHDNKRAIHARLYTKCMVILTAVSNSLSERWIEARFNYKLQIFYKLGGTWGEPLGRDTRLIDTPLHCIYRNLTTFVFDLLR